MTSRLPVSAAVIGLLFLGVPALSTAQGAAGSLAEPAAQVASTTFGSIQGVVRDDRDLPIAGALVSALGANTALAVTDRTGRFELPDLAPGPYFLRAHLSGYIAPPAQMIAVRASERLMSAVILRRASAPPLAAGVGAASEPAPLFGDQATAESEASDDDTAGQEEDRPSRAVDHGETAWRLRHARRGVLKEVTDFDELLADSEPGDSAFWPVGVLNRAVGSPARVATSFFADTPFSGQVNLLTAGSFQTPKELFSSNGLPHGIAHVHLGAPVGSHGNWTLRGAFTQGDISSWILAGSYATRESARHSSSIGWSYSTQRYDGGNVLARRDVSEGSRNVGTVYGYGTFAIIPALSVSYGGSYARYDFLDDSSLVSPRLEVTAMPAERTRISAVISRTARAPGAEEFLPPGDTGIWLPPQRTFSSLEPGRPMSAEHTMHMAIEVERDIAASTISLRAFRQDVDGQLATVFGADLPAQPNAKVGHYFVGNAGDAKAIGCTAELRTLLAGRIHGSVAYSLMNAQLTPAEDVRYLVWLAPSALHRNSERIHDVATSIETSVPETLTRVLVLYRVSNAFAGSRSTDGPGLGSRFDIQVRQSLPFLNFTSARWEMLLAVRDFFRETAIDQSIYDELLVVRPPKRIVGGVTMHF